MNTLQSILLASDKSHGPDNCYLQSVSGDYASTDDTLSMPPQTCVSGLTFYNAFSPQKWRTNTNLESFLLDVRGEGILRVQLLAASIEDSSLDNLSLDEESPKWPLKERLLDDVTLDLSYEEPGLTKRIELSDIDEELIYFRLAAENNVSVSNARFITPQEPVSTVKLGIVITHFNRQKQLTEAVDRISGELFDKGDYNHEHKLFVIDNSNNCGLKSSQHVEIIPNCNYGGSGGFARGMLEVESSGRFTHCLFMDDDASCEVEAIRRMAAFFEHATDPKLSIAGSLIEIQNGYTLYEKGAYFDGLCHRIHAELDMRDASHLILAEREIFPTNYGGWWLYGFCLKGARYYPFPFFVRGDDVAFSITNQLRVVTLNGIASYGETFESKHSSLTAYLDTRAHLVQQLAVLNHGRIKVMAGFARFFAISLLSYKYGSTEATRQALEDLMQGPAFFHQNKDMQNRFNLLREMGQADLGEPLEQAPADLLLPSRNDESSVRKLCRILTLNGLILPPILKREGTIFQKPGFKVKYSETFGFRRIYLATTPDSRGNLLTFNFRNSLVEVASFTILSIKLFFQFSNLAKEYREDLPKSMSKEYWEEVYSEAILGWPKKSGK